MDSGSYSSNGQYRPNINAPYPPQYGPPHVSAPYPPQYGPQINAPNPPQYGPPHISGPNPPQYGPPHYGYGPNAPRIGVQMNFNQPNFSGPAPGFREIPDSAHMHPLFQEPAYSDCKICRRQLGGLPGYVCHDCPLSLCIECFNNIFYGNKQRQVHPHTLSLRTRPNWICDVCHRNFSGTASFYCKACDVDACSMCYIGY